MLKSCCFLLIILSYSCSKKQGLFHPIENIKIGTTKEEVLSKLGQYKTDGVVDSSNIILLNGENVKISFTFCADCFDEKREAIELRTTNNKKLISFLNDSIYFDKNEINIKTFVIKDIMLDSVVCIYSDKIRYNNEFASISCKRNPNRPCWE